ncbi:hypothetical protein RFI_13225 [Reticulomyxa filosa]|uniref:Uncharacterized protein n=1 Tax=Reticulomyxa filosa TaxID=46433 RepID=X6NF29_RETFI|nr:hypothetical protein RFI_13225 [Reticulomyxa filosa]|eukprot:ETO23937.1 hypothetical protein RFI_13225 [Reticulomyxa filosa]
METQMKERRIIGIQLRNALQSRPTPDDISDSEPNEVSPDLVKYLKWLRETLINEDEQKTEATMDDDEHNANAVNGHSTTSRRGRDMDRPVYHKMRSRSIDRLEWKLAQRITVNEIAARSLIPAEYIPTINTDKEYTEAEKEKQTHFLTAEEKLKRKMKLKMQPTPQELFQRGVLVEPSLSDPDVVDRVKAKRRNIRKKFAVKYKQRMPKEEAIQRHIVDKDDFEKDHDEVEQARKKERSDVKKKLTQRVVERPDQKEIVQRAFVDEMEFVQNHDDVIKSKKQQREDVTLHLGEKIKQRPRPGDATLSPHLPDGDFEQGSFPSHVHAHASAKHTSTQSTNQSSISAQQTQQQAASNLTPNPYQLHMSDHSSPSRDLVKYQPTLEEMRSDPEITLKMNIPSNFMQRMQQDAVESKQLSEALSQQHSPEGRELTHGRQMSTASELALFFKSRPEMATLFAKGILKAGVISEDGTSFSPRVAQRQLLQNSLSKKLDKHKRPSQRDLELRGIVPHGYFQDVVEFFLFPKNNRNRTLNKQTCFLLFCILKQAKGIDRKTSTKKNC